MVNISGSDASSFDVIQRSANVDVGGDGTVTDDDPFALSKDEFFNGIAEFSEYVQLSDEEASRLWEAIADGKTSITKEDFKLSDIKETMLEFTGDNIALMSFFADFMDQISQSSHVMGNEESHEG